LASSFNFRGRLKQLFYVLTDDKIGSGPRPAPHSLQNNQKAPVTQAPPEASQDSETNPGSAAATDQVGAERKRKADDTPSTRGKSKR